MNISFHLRFWSCLFVWQFHLIFNRCIVKFNFFELNFFRRRFITISTACYYWKDRVYTSWAIVGKLSVTRKFCSQTSWYRFIFQNLSKMKYLFSMFYFIHFHFCSDNNSILKMVYVTVSYSQVPSPSRRCDLDGTLCASMVSWITFTIQFSTPSC